MSMREHQLDNFRRRKEELWRHRNLGAMPHSARFVGNLYKVSYFDATCDAHTSPNESPRRSESTSESRSESRSESTSQTRSESKSESRWRRRAMHWRQVCNHVQARCWRLVGKSSAVSLRLLVTCTHVLTHLVTADRTLPLPSRVQRRKRRRWWRRQQHLRH